jgi:uncharacterized protein (DUF58 family)
LATVDKKQFLHPEAIKRIARLDLQARHIVEGFLAGMHRSPYFGQSVEFLQHREYSHGDDLRKIDWKVWAKQDRYYVKQYEEDTNLRATLLVDVSHSMQYGRGPMNKYEYACTSAVSLAYLLLRQQDAVGCLAFDEGVRATVGMRTKRSHLNAIIQSLSVSRPQKKTDLQQILRNAAELFPHRGMMILISDLLVERPGLIKGLKLMRQRGHDVLVLHIMDDDELDFPFSGPTRFDGLELPQHVSCNPRALREGYLAALNLYLEEIRRACTQNEVDYRLVRTSEPLDAVLAHFISNRMGMMRRA